MKSNAKSKILILLTLGIFFALLPVITVNLSYIADNSNNTLDNENLKLSAVSETIHIDNNWTAAKVAGIVTGNGTYSEPYLIEDLVIDGGGSGSGIFIENSNDYFIIRNCTVYNSGSGFWDAGIKLESVSNGILINNNFSNNIHGIILDYSYNITVSGNTANNNHLYGIYLSGSDNNTVSGNNATNNWFGTYLSDSGNNTVSGNTADNNFEGIKLYNSNDNTVSGNNATNNDKGLQLASSYNNTVSGNDTNNNTSYGIRLASSYNNTVSGNTVNNNAAGIGLNSSYNNTVSGNNATNNDNGIYLDASDNNTISQNTANNNLFGIYLSYSYNNTLWGNNMTQGGVYIDGYSKEHFSSHNIDTTNLVNDKPVYYYANEISLGTYNFTFAGDPGQVILANCSNSNVSNLNLSYASMGISLFYSDNNTVSGNTVKNNLFGIILINSDENRLMDNICNSNAYESIYLSGSHNNELANNNALNNENYGIHLSGSHNNELRNNIASNNGLDGIHLTGSHNNELRNNDVSNNFAKGIHIMHSSNTRIIENTANSNFYGIALFSSYNSTLSRNAMLNNGFTVSGYWYWWATGEYDDFIQNIDTSNTINGKPIYYWMNQHDKQVPSDAGYVGIINSTNIIVKDLSLFNNGEGVLVVNSNNLRIENVYLSQNYIGIRIIHSFNNVLSSNTILSNPYGIEIDTSSQNTLTNNIIQDSAYDSLSVDGRKLSDFMQNIDTSNIINGKPVYYWINRQNEQVPSDAGYVGLVNCSNIIVRNVSLSNTAQGIELAYTNYTRIVDVDAYGIVLIHSFYNTITKNVLHSYRLPAITFKDSSENYIYFNNFIDLDRSFIYIWGDSNNVWRSPTNITYNYNDTIHINFLGNYWIDYSENDPDEDGIGDTPYNIDGDKDYYPLMEPFENYLPAVNSPNDISYEEGTTGHSISWTAFDNNPGTYVIYRNDIEVDSGLWTSGIPITINVDGLTVGSYNYTINVTYSLGDSISDTVIVFIEDITAPIVDNPANITYEEHTTGHNISWTATDNNPGFYVIYMNEIETDSGSWTSGVPITINVDGLAIGSYNYTIVVSDVYDNSATDTVIVIVEDITEPVVDSPDNITYNEGDAGNEISWTANDLNPATYSITKDGTEIESGNWVVDGQTFTVDVDGLSYGTYTYVFTIYDVGGNFAMDTVIVNVSDGTTPILTHPTDITYNEGDAGNEIAWTANDLNPATYSITKDGTEIESGNWVVDGQTFTVDVDGLSYGTYTYVITVYDVDGNFAMDTVIVNVNEVIEDDADDPIISEPEDVYYEAGEEGNSITWVAIDANPDYFELYVDGVLIIIEDWESGVDIVIHVDGLENGTYEYTIIVYDKTGNSASDMVEVKVTGISGGNNGIPGYELEVVVLVSLFTVIFLIKKKKNKLLH